MAMSSPKKFLRSVVNDVWDGVAITSLPSAQYWLPFSTVRQGTMPRRGQGIATING
jgi:hypothetical protein